MIKYFLYSKEQHKTRMELEKKIGRKYVPGVVMIGGEAKLFTEISSKYNDRFKDTIIVYQGEETSVKYTKPKSVNLRG